jgi:hypothetical protein
MAKSTSGDVIYELLIEDNASAALLRVAESAQRAAEAVNRHADVMAEMHAAIRKATGRAADA